MNFIENIRKGRSMNDRFTSDIFERLMSELPTYWDGKESIMFMKNNGSRQWRQMEWPGFYFQFMCEQILGKNEFFEIPGKSYGRVEFDGFRDINFDFKAHYLRGLWRL